MAGSFEPPVAFVTMHWVQRCHDTQRDFAHAFFWDSFIPGYPTRDGSLDAGDPAIPLLVFRAPVCACGLLWLMGTGSLLMHGIGVTLCKF